jgi:hypothetical protein
MRFPDNVDRRHVSHGRLALYMHAIPRRLKRAETLDFAAAI